MVARAALLFLPPDRGLMPWAEPPSGTAEKGEKTMLDAYELLSREEIRDVRAEGYLLRHKKTGARIAVLSNEDENKVFSIAFRTPPKNSTGVAHIIEHTVLCGSRKFPLKDPFVELAKGSLNTFLNAMTYPDKTVYPVASCNDRDFQNLMDVYLDAVFYPNIYQNEKIFRQEGWHYQLEREEDPLTYNGVVYNEMKGAFSTPDEVLGRAMMNALFPDTPYGVESGGDPEVIPELTYEEFLEFHRTYYHPSNSYIYLYGNIDIEEKLDWLDREYLSRFESRRVDSAIPLQEAFGKIRDLRMSYPVLDQEPLEDNTYLASSRVVGTSLDTTLNVAFSVLEYALLDAPGAPVKQALLDAGIGKDVEGSYEDGILQPSFSIVAKHANAGDKERFLRVIQETLEQILRDGVDRKALASGINFFEFRFREADYSSFPRGLIYGLDMLDSWLYDETRPFDYLKQISVFEELKARISQGYFEKLIRTYLLENPHGAVIVLEPERGLAEKREQETAEKLAAYKASLGSQEIRNLVQATEELKAYQESEDSQEAIESIPLLKREDIQRKTPVKLSMNRETAEGMDILHQDYDTNGIAYLTLLFDAAGVPDSLVPWLGLLKSVLGSIRTEHYDHTALFHEINGSTGGISCGLQIFPNREQPENFRRMFGIRAKYLYPKRQFVFDMVWEILLTSCLEDEKRLREILSSVKGRLQTSIPAAGHLSAATRALSYQSPAFEWQERTAGITYYRLVEELESHFEERKEEIIRNLKLLMKYLFRPENLTVSITAEKEGLAGVKEAALDLRSQLCREPLEPGRTKFTPEQKNEGFKTSGQVQFVAAAGNFRRAGYEYTGALRILRTILNYDYLWINLRVKGGAYGCMGAFQRTGDSYLASYRDPHLERTLEVYRGLPEYLRNFQADEREMTKYIIGTVSELDTPMNAAAKGALCLNAWYTHYTEEDFQKEREEILDASPEKIRELEGIAKAILEENNLCVIGSSAAIEKHRELFGTVENLIRS